MPVFSKVVGKVLRQLNEVDEPMVDEQMGMFGDIRIPVIHRPGSAQNWSANGNALDYVTPQTQELERNGTCCRKRKSTLF